MLDSTWRLAVEPVTPPGAVYVTEPFAAAIALSARDDFGCDYVGHMPAAKDFGRLRMYRLRWLRRLHHHEHHIKGSDPLYVRRRGPLEPEPRDEQRKAAVER